MKRHAPEVRDYMTHLPVELDRCETARQAVSMMHQHGIHHIPVMSGSHLRGIVSRSELLEAEMRLKADFDDTPLDQVCPSHTLVIRPTDAIDEVARRMLDQQVDCAAVVDGGFVVGIFTSTDALRFLSDFFGNPHSTR